jgi:hypothetical protein
MIAHAGRFTWDEFLIVASPLVVIAALLGLARKRVRSQRKRSMSAPSDDSLPTKSS